MAAGTPSGPGAGRGLIGRAGPTGLLALFGLGVVVVALLAVRDEPVVWPSEADSTRVDPEGDARVESVLADANAYYGRDITLGGRVGQLVAPRAFTLRAGGEEILVVAPHPLPPAPGPSADRPLAVGDRLAVTGEFRSFDRLFFQRDLGYDLDGALFGAWEDRPAMIALWIDRTP